MIYDDGTGRRIYRGLGGRRRPPEDAPEPSDAAREAIHRVVESHPHWGSRQVFAELRLTRHDIPLAVVEAVVEDLQHIRATRRRYRW